MSPVAGDSESSTTAVLRRLVLRVPDVAPLLIAVTTFEPAVFWIAVLPELFRFTSPLMEKFLNCPAPSWISICPLEVALSVTSVSASRLVAPPDAALHVGTPPTVVSTSLLAPGANLETIIPALEFISTLVIAPSAISLDEMENEANSKPVLDALLLRYCKLPAEDKPEMAEVPFPDRMPDRVVAPVPPRFTGSVPVVILEVLTSAMSALVMEFDAI